MKSRLLIYFLIASLASFILIIACKMGNKSENVYMEQIGDTPFDPDLDNPDFKFCDSLNVLHKRTRISYTGGDRKLEEDLIENYKPKDDYQSFSGYFIIRFAVNCKNKTGRFRWQVVDQNFDETEPPKGLEKEIINMAKSLDSWNSITMDGEKYDGYKFILIKIVNGKIIKS